MVSSLSKLMRCRVPLIAFDGERWRVYGIELLFPSSKLISIAYLARSSSFILDGLNSYERKRFQFRKFPC